MTSPYFHVVALLCYSFTISGVAVVKGQTDAATRLNTRLAEIDAMQCEVDQLRQHLGQDKYLSVTFTELKLNITELLALTNDVQFTRSFPRFLPQEMHMAADVSELEKELVRRRVASVLFKSTWPIKPGRSHSFNVGGEVPFVDNGGTQITWKQFGTSFSIAGSPLGSNRVRLKANVNVRSIDDARTVALNGQEWVAFSTCEFDEVFEGTDGETFFVWMPTGDKVVPCKVVERREENPMNEYQVVWLIRAKILDYPSTSSP